MPIRRGEIAFRRMIAKLAGQRLRKRKIPMMREPKAAQLRFQIMLKEMHRTLSQLLFEQVIDELPNIVAQGIADRGGVRRDAAIDDILRVFSNFPVLFAEAHPPIQTETQLNAVGEQVDTINSEGFQRQMKAGLGVELITPEPFRQATIQAFVQENLELVKSLHTDQIKRFRSIVSRGVQSGQRVEYIRDQLMNQLGVAKSKASLLARDQTLRLHGEMTELRQTNVGIEEYDWDSSQDERVRPRHAELHGTRQRWDDPPIVDYKSGRRAHPGQDYQCRCNAVPVLDALLESE